MAKDFVNADKVKQLQQYLRDTGGDITVDGILGKKTINHMLGRNYTDLLILYKDLPYNKMSLRTKILDYLAGAEGKHLHWNSTEGSFTTMYGIYAKKHKKSKPILYIKRRAKELGFRSITRRNIHKLDRALTTHDKSVLTDLIYDYYVKIMFLKDIIGLVSPDTYLTYFSLAVHGGKQRGVKALKSALGIPLSKTWTNSNTDTLRRTKLSDIEINDGMLDYMQSFYDYLIRTNPAKYGIYKKGWNNRLRRLRRSQY